MEIVSIERSTYSEMMSRFGQFTRKIISLCEQREEKKMSEWLDSQEVCMILDIGKRKLQYLRNTRKLPFSMIGGKNYYKPEDVEKIIKKCQVGKEVYNG
jgi:hypothetical protein